MCLFVCLFFVFFAQQLLLPVFDTLLSDEREEDWYSLQQVCIAATTYNDGMSLFCLAFTTTIVNFTMKCFKIYKSFLFIGYSALAIIIFG